MFRLTPYRNADIFDIFHDMEKNLWGTPAKDKESVVGSCKTDIREESGRYILEAELPGFSKEDIAIDIEGEYLSLSAQKKTETEKKDGNYIRRERTYGAYKRSFSLENVDSEKIEAKYENGVLTLNLPKKDNELPSTRRLQIN